MLRQFKDIIDTVGLVDMPVFLQYLRGVVKEKVNPVPLIRAYWVPRVFQPEERNLPISADGKGILAIVTRIDRK